MPNKLEEKSAMYPLVPRRYRINLRDANGAEAEIRCSNVAVGQLSHDLIDYKDGTGNWFKVRGQPKEITVSLKRGVFIGDDSFYKWFSNSNHNAIESRDVTISLTDEGGENPLVTWSVPDAHPVSLSAPPFDASSNEIAIEELSLVATRMTVLYA